MIWQHISVNRVIGHFVDWLANDSWKMLDQDYVQAALDVARDWFYWVKHSWNLLFGRQIYGERSNSVLISLTNRK